MKRKYLIVAPYICNFKHKEKKKQKQSGYILKKTLYLAARSEQARFERALH